jgi:hypothetical protein
MPQDTKNQYINQYFKELYCKFLTYAAVVQQPQAERGCRAKFFTLFAKQRGATPRTYGAVGVSQLATRTLLPCFKHSRFETYRYSSHYRRQR